MHLKIAVKMTRFDTYSVVKTKLVRTIVDVDV
jgi:hypothetical protein